MTNQKGQVLTETLIVIPVLILLLFGVLSVSYSIYSREVSSLVLYRSLICTEELNKSPKACFKSAEKKLKRVLFFHENIKLSKKISENNRVVKLTAVYLTFKTKYKKSLRVQFQ